MAKKLKRAIESRRLDQLFDHPRQSELFGNLNEYDLRNLADNITTNGLEQPIEVLPGGNAAGLPADTITRGHQRRLALQLLGYTEADVIVQYDLVNSDRATVDLYFIADNLDRRQLTPLAKARAAMAVFDLERGRSSEELSDRDAGDARDRVAASLNLGSGRNLQRYLNVLKAPLCVQHGLEAGELKLVLAERVSRLPQSDQDEIAERVADGENACVVVSEYLRHHDQQRGKTSAMIKGMLRGLTLASDLVARLEDLPPHKFADCVAKLERGRKSLTELIAFARRKS